MQHFLMWMGLLALAGCGVSETAVTAAAGAATKAQEVEAAKDTQERVGAQLDAASLQAQQRLQNAEAAGN